MGTQMASPGELVKKVSQVTGINEATVASTHRYLRDAGLITKGGRGTSSARMTNFDASNIIIALLAATSINESPEVVAKYGRLSMRKLGAIHEMPGIVSETDSNVFALCLQNLFQAFLSGEVAKAVSKFTGEEYQTEDLNYDNAEISIGIKRPTPEASICLRAIVGKDQDVSYVPILDLAFERNLRVGSKKIQNVDPPISASEIKAGLQEYRWIDLKVVTAIAEVL